MRCRLVDCYRRFETTYWSHLLGSSSLLPLKIWLILYSEILVTNYHPCCVKSQKRENPNCQVVSDMNYADRHVHDLPITHSLIFCTMCSAITEMNIYVAIWMQCFLKMGQYSSTPFILSDLWHNYSLYQSEFSIECNSASFPCNFQYPLFSLRPSSSWLCLLPHPPIISILPSIFLSITCFGKQFLCRMWPIQLASSFFNVCRLYSSPPWLYIVLLHFSDGQISWSSLSLSSTIKSYAPDVAIY
jgi:hypothetical protein